MAAGCFGFQELRRTRRFFLIACLLLLQTEVSLAAVLQGYRPKDVVSRTEDGVFVVSSELKRVVYFFSKLS